MFIRSDCGACEHMIKEVMPKVDVPDVIDIYSVVVDREDNTHFPPLRTPILYVYIPNSPKIPIMREGVAPPDIVEKDFGLMIEVMNGADYWETFFKDAPPEAIPEHEKR